MLSIRPLTILDARLLAEIGKRSVVESHGHSAPEGVMETYAANHFNEDACFAELSDFRNLFYGAFYNDQPAGYSKIMLDQPNPGIAEKPVTKMERLYLLKDFYGMNIGNGLMKEALSLSKAAGEKGMWLNVWKGNPRAIRFYEKHGFKPVGEFEFIVTPSHSNPNWVMWLPY